MTRASRIKINAINKGTYIWSIQFNICIQHYIPKFLSSTGSTKVHIWCSIRKQDRLRHTILQSLISQKQISEIVNKRVFFFCGLTLINANLTEGGSSEVVAVSTWLSGTVPTALILPLEKQRELEILTILSVAMLLILLKLCETEKEAAKP